jgi:hypothetical protein
MASTLDIFVFRVSYARSQLPGGSNDNEPMKPAPRNKRLARAHQQRLRSRVLLMALLGTFLHFSAAGSHASTITVNTDADAGGICPGPTCTLRQAIAAAPPGGTIDFANGLTTINLTSAELLIDKDLTISGPGADLLTVQRNTTTPKFRIFNIASSAVARKAVRPSSSGQLARRSLNSE